jgi:hypothetical protein
MLQQDETRGAEKKLNIPFPWLEERKKRALFSPAGFLIRKLRIAVFAKLICQQTRSSTFIHIQVLLC